MTTKTKILLGPSSFAQENKKPLELLQASGLDITDNPYKRKLTKDETLTLLGQNTIGLIAGLETLDREVMQKTGLKVISRVGSGMNNVDQDAAKELGVLVYSTPDGPTNAVAELTIGALLSLLRGIPTASTALHNKKWEKKIGGELRGKKLAIIGFGRIGQRVGELAAAFGATILAVDPFAKESKLAKILPLEAALKEADIITLHSSGKNQILGEKEIKSLKPSALLLNASRGELVDEKALAQSIQTGHLAGAWIDTFVQEPYAGPLCDLPQVILTPHIGSYTAECRLSMEMEAAQNLLLGLKEIHL